MQHLPAGWLASTCGGGCVLFLPCTRALCYFCHGVSEYVERYGEMAAVLNKVGVAVYGHDHGKESKDTGNQLSM